MEQINFDELRPSFANLPMELIILIFAYLNAADRKMAGTTCRRWLAASDEPQFQSKVVLHFRKTFLSDLLLPIAIYLQSSRKFMNLYLDQADLGTMEIFFDNFGCHIQEITFDSLDIAEKQFKSILKSLKIIRSLNVINYSVLFTDEQFFESESDRILLSDILKNTKTLSLVNNPCLSDAIVFRLTSMMPKLEQLNMSNCKIARYNRIHKRFYPKGRKNAPSEDILTFQYIVKIIKNHVDTLNDLDLSKTMVGGPDLIQLSKIKNWNLRKLILRSCKRLTSSGLVSLFKTHKNLTHLDISSSRLLTNDCIYSITNELSQLEILKIARCKALTNQNAIMLRNLKKLKVLDISYSDNLDGDGIIQGIAKEVNVILEELYLTGIDISENCVIKCAESFPNLKVFDLGFCFNGVTDLALQIIIKNLPLLRTLNLEFCNHITDSGLTGTDMSGKLDMYDSGKCFTVTPQKQTLKMVRFLGVDVYTHSTLRSEDDEAIVEDAKRKQIICKNITLNSDPNIRKGYSIKQLKGLQSLNLRGCKITDVSLKYELKFNEIRVLSLSDCPKISVLGIISLVENCPSIEDLYLSRCHNIREIGIDIITKGLKRLNLLNISGCMQFTNHSLDYIVHNCNYIKKLSIHGCGQISQEPNLLPNVPSLQTIHTKYSSSKDSLQIKRHPPPWDF